MDESYTLKVRSDSDTARLAANEVWGALRGLETFSQLVHVNPDFGYYQVSYCIASGLRGRLLY